MNRREHLLEILGEEGGEVGHRASKANRFGLAEVQPGQTLSNRERLLQEWVDMHAVMEMLQDDGHLVLPTPEEMRPGIEAKKAKVEKFLAYSRECGTLVDDVPNAVQ